MRKSSAVILLTLLCLAAGGRAGMRTIAMTGASNSALPQREKKDYLTDMEADKIRDAETPSERVKLFLAFAADRLKKFQYELSRGPNGVRRSETLNGLLNAYSACVDDAADVIGLQLEKQGDIRAGLKEMKTKAKEFLETLEKLNQGGTEFDLYKQTLADALEGTRDALNDAEQAEKKMPGPPVRRKP